MNLDFTPEEQAFRDQVRRLLRTELPDGLRRQILAGAVRAAA